MRRSILADAVPDFRIIRSFKRKRIALRFAPDGVLEILAPSAVPEEFLRAIPVKEGELIARLRSRTQRLARPALILEENAKFALLGEFYPLHLSSRLRIFDGDRFIIPRGSEEAMRENLIALYKELSEKALIKRAKVLEESTGLHAESYRITSAGTRWGSCNNRKVIALSWKLIQCPKETIDYVIIHELAHLKELNHSAKFWKIVENFCPQYRTMRQKLNDFARALPPL